jgi:hypothetical protein
MRSGAKLLETRRYPDGVVHLRYEVPRRREGRAARTHAKGANRPSPVNHREDDATGLAKLLVRSALKFQVVGVSRTTDHLTSPRA